MLVLWHYELWSGLNIIGRQSKEVLKATFVVQLVQFTGGKLYKMIL
jgi:hypothetical protein